uniref:IS30 family transposase n=1 Tax=Hoyosella subflava TaxID=639313 RepID=UPI0011D2B392
MTPSLVKPPSGRYLSFEEREMIGMRYAAKCSIREIARQLDRAPSTVKREIDRGYSKTSGNRRYYTPTYAQAKAEERAQRPKDSKLATNERLRSYVQDQLKRNLSPQQIAGRLKVDFPDDEEMRVSHESIYRSLYVQTRGSLKRELARHLRTGRSLRKPNRTADKRRGRIPGMVNVSERPPEADTRKVPGHWEGDLIMGKDGATAIGTLVERASGFVMLLHLPDGHSAMQVQDAIVEKMGQLPELLRRSLTWDQGKELTRHVQIAAATGLKVYFCDPHSPWQRGSNENTNGLLRQYFPKGTDLSLHGPGILDLVATELNDRPRKRHGYATPAEKLQQLLSNEQPENPGVARTP